MPKEICDHIIASSQYDGILRTSDMTKWDEDDSDVYIHNYCPLCGEKLR